MGNIAIFERVGYWRGQFPFPKKRKKKKSRVFFIILPWIFFKMETILFHWYSETEINYSWNPSRKPNCFSIYWKLLLIWIFATTTMILAGFPRLGLCLRFCSKCHALLSSNRKTHSIFQIDFPFLITNPFLFSVWVHGCYLDVLLISDFYFSGSIVSSI